MENFDDLTRTKVKRGQRSEFIRNDRRGTAPVEMTFVLFPLMLLMGATIAFGSNAFWKMRTEIVARDVAWRNRHPHHGIWNSNRDVRSAEFPEARQGRELADDSGRTEVATYRFRFDNDLSSFQDDAVVHAPIIRGPIPSVNVNSELLNLARSVDTGEARLLRKPTIMPKMGQVDFRTHHGFLGHSFQCAESGMNLIDHERYHVRGSVRWSNYVRRIPYIYETELDYVIEFPAYLNAIAQVESVRNPFCLAIDEESLS